MRYKIKSIEKPGYNAELIRKKLIDIIARSSSGEIIKMYGYAYRLHRDAER